VIGTTARYDWRHVRTDGPRSGPAMSQPRHGADADEPQADADESTEAPSATREPSARRNRWLWVGPAALAVALIAIGIAAWALLRQPAAPAPASPTSQQVDDAKGRACAAYTTVRTAVSLQTNIDLGPEPVARQAAAANGRLAMVASGSYLNAHLDPATPAELATAIRSFADDLQAIAMNALAGVGNDDPTQAARLRDGEAISRRIADLCK
jgi:hypothetical protein